VKKVWLGVLVAVVWAVPAQAVMLNPERQPFQRWADEALVPTPNVTLGMRVSAFPCGYDGRWVPVCVHIDSAGKLSVWATRHVSRLDFYWALAGALVWTPGAIPKSTKHHLDRILHEPHWRSTAYEDVFSVCAGTRPANVRKTHFRDGGGSFTRHQMRAACQALAEQLNSGRNRHRDLRGVGQTLIGQHLRVGASGLYRHA
jgi:hypothetical protein